MKELSKKVKDMLFGEMSCVGNSNMTNSGIYGGSNSSNSTSMHPRRIDCEDAFVLEKECRGYRIEKSFSSAVYHNSSVSLKVFDTQSSQQIPCTFEWNYSLQQHATQQQYKHHLTNSPDHDDFQNAANIMIARIGPIEMDPETRYSVQSVLYSGIVSIPVRIGSSLDSYNLIITPQHITLRSANLVNTAATRNTEGFLKITNDLHEVSIAYCARRGPLSERQFALKFPKGGIIEHQQMLEQIEVKGNSIVLHAESRGFRDYIYLVVRALAAKQTFLNEKILANINNDPRTYIPDFNAFTDAILRYMDSSKVLTAFAQRVRTLTADKERLIACVGELEEECELIVQTFQSILSEQGIHNPEQKYQSKREQYSQQQYATLKNYQTKRCEETEDLRARVSELEEQVLLFQSFEIKSNTMFSFANHNNNNNNNNSSRNNTDREINNNNGGEMATTKGLMQSSRMPAGSTGSAEVAQLKRRLSAAYMELEEMRDQHAKEVQVLLNTEKNLRESLANLEAENKSLTGTIASLQKSNEFLSNDTRCTSVAGTPRIPSSAAAGPSINGALQSQNQSSAYLHREFELMKTQMAEFQHDIVKRQASKDELAQLKIQNERMAAQLDRLSRSTNNNSNMSKSRIFDATPTRPLPPPPNFFKDASETSTKFTNYSNPSNNNNNNNAGQFGRGSNYAAASPTPTKGVMNNSSSSRLFTNNDDGWKYVNENPFLKVERDDRVGRSAGVRSSIGSNSSSSSSCQRNSNNNNNHGMMLKEDKENIENEQCRSSRIPIPTRPVQSGIKSIPQRPSEPNLNNSKNPITSQKTPPAKQRSNSPFFGFFY